MVKDEVPEAGSEPVPRQGTHCEGDILTEDRRGGGARTGRLAPASEEPARAAVRPEGLEFRELPSPYAEDEISLIDLWLVLVRRRLILGATLLACILAGLWFAFLQPPSYAFTTVIQIGRVVELRGLGETVARVTPNGPLELSETVVAKLNEGYIPKVLAAYVNEANVQTTPKIEASGLFTAGPSSSPGNSTIRPTCIVVVNAYDGGWRSANKSPARMQASTVATMIKRRRTSTSHTSTRLIWSSS